MATNPFIERYSKLTNAELLKIIRRADDYQPLAVQTAQEELDRRNLTDEQLADAKSINEQKHHEETKHQEKVKAVEDKLKSISSSVYDAINPVRTKELTIDKWIKGICLLMGVSFLYMIVKDFALIKFIFTDSASQWDFTTVLFILLYLFIPVTTILFWYRKKLGWILLAGYLSLSGCLSLYFSITGIFIKQWSTLFQPSTVINLGEIIFFFGGVVFLCRLATRDIYGITKNMMLISVGVPTVITTLICSQLLVTALSRSDKNTTTKFEIHSSTSVLENTTLPMPEGSAMPNLPGKETVTGNAYTQAIVPTNDTALSIGRKPLKFSLKNLTNIAIKEISVGLPDTTVNFSKLSPKMRTGWIHIKSAYSYGYLKFKDLRDREYEVRPKDYVGETLYIDGYMTFIIESIDTVSKRGRLNFSRERDK